MSDPHSALYFGDSRDHWYNADFLDLMAQRWRLGECLNVLDVGAGVGHWTRLLLPRLAPSARVSAVEREQQWVDEAKRSADERVSFFQGDLNALPFPDATFDLVTCQTVLIHVPDVRRALGEMLRVLAPGGLLAVAEPNNLAQSLVLGSTAFHGATEDIVDLVRLRLMCQRGKEALGEGNDSIGDLLPGYFQELGLADISCFLSDRTETCIPPYASAAERALVEDMRSFQARGMWIWDQADTRRYFLAAGGEAPDFERLWRLALEASAAQVDAVAKGTWHEAGARCMYLIAGRKP